MTGRASICVGDVIDGKYEITGVLGEGGMGVVYTAMHRRLQRVVALKTMQSDSVSDEELLARFEREARAASAIGHPNIVQIYDAGGEPIPYLVMEYLQGQSLGDLLGKRKRLEVEHALRLCQQCLLGLAAAHRAGIVHRDLKPENIFIANVPGGSQLPDSEQVKILDFGISKILESPANGSNSNPLATVAGTVLGTPYYMSPEQVAGRIDIDQRTDLWAMACVLYECLTGEPPFAGDNFNQIMAAVLSGQFIALRERRPDAGDALSAVLDKALSLELTARFGDSETFSQALLAAQGAQIAGRAVASSGVAGSAVASSAVEDSAFDDLASRAQAQERDVGSVNPAVATPPWPLDPRTPPPSEADRFAPPQPKEGASLVLRTDRLPKKRPTTSLEPQRRTKLKRPKRSERVTRQDSSGVVATFFKLLLLVAIAAGGLAGYRYNTLGYVLPQEQPKVATLVLQVQPSSAFVYLDSRRYAGHSLALEGGKEYEVAVRAAHYLKVRSAVFPNAGDQLVATVIMDHAIPLVDAESPGDPSFPRANVPALSFKEVDEGYEKLSALILCGTRLSKALSASLLRQAGDGGIAISYNLVDECRLSIEVNVAKSPAIEPLDGASTALVSTLEDLNKALRNQKASVGSGSKVRRSARAEVEKTRAKAKRSRDFWLVSMNQSQARWLSEDAARIRKREGVSMHVLLRDVAVASDRWLRAHLAGAKSSHALHRAFVKAHKVAGAHAEQHVAQYKGSGGASFLRAMSPLLATKPGEQAVYWHNQAIGLFNDLKLPFTMTTQ